VDRALLDPNFLSCLTGSPYGRAYFVRCSKQSTNLASINTAQLKAFPVICPPLPEQQNIARCLGTWDSAIRQCSSVIRAKDRLRRALAHQLVSGKVGGPGFGKSGHTDCVLAEVVKKIRRPVTVNPQMEYTEIGVRSHGKGVFHKPPVLGPALGDK